MESQDCYRCWQKAVAKEPRDNPIAVLMIRPRMFLCMECGNKRCPKATDHRLDCTGSNAPGQEGSIYA